MNRKNYRFQAVTVFLCLLPFSVLKAQIPQPVEWGQFVNTTKNTLLTDTFRIQTFKNSLGDNWKYTIKNKAEIADLSAEELNLPKGSKGLKMKFPAEVEFEPFSLADYQNVLISFYYGGEQLESGDNLLVETFRDGKYNQLTVNNVKKKEEHLAYFKQEIARSPSSLKFFTKNSLNSEGYYAFLYVKAIGSIAAGSHFTGTGNWNDTIRWSHLPAARHRTALIEGNISVTENILCDHVHLNKSSLFLSNNSELQVKTLELYDTESEISGGGKLTIDEELKVHYTFPQKGKWFFVSFPFDIYADEVNPLFTHKDAAPNQGGNYFYVQTYDGSRRAKLNQSTGNWKVLPGKTGHSLLFERGKGYLIALDEAATNQDIYFYSQDKSRNASLLTMKQVALTFPIEKTTENSLNFGWQLCGNPFPYPLHFSQIKTSGMDGCIYLYNQGSYTSYSITDNRTIPPYTPFFVKAERAGATLSFEERTSFQTKAAPHVSYSSCYMNDEEPSGQSEVMSNQSINTHLYYKLIGNQFIIDNPYGPGLCRIYNWNGQLITQYPLHTGRNMLEWNETPGFYIYDIKIKEEHIKGKLLKF